MSCKDKVQVTYFVGCPDMPGGYGDYVSFSGTVGFLDIQERRLRVYDTEIRFDEPAELNVGFFYDCKDSSLML